MASILRSQVFLRPSAGLSTTSFETPKRAFFPFKQGRSKPYQVKISQISPRLSIRVPEFLLFAANGETTETSEVEEEIKTQEESHDEVSDEDGASDGGIGDVDGKPVSAILTLLQSYKESLESGDESKVAEIEANLLSFEDEKISLANKVAILSEELSVEKERILRISADFDNFRKRTERERLSLVTNAQGEVVENLLPVLDNFERAKSQIKVENEGEEKINNSYQSIYKQFVEILGSLGVVPVETIGNSFDPLLHEAIMREDSTEFEEGIVIQEFRKGFKLGDRLLRPSMVKVSAGPGPEKPEEAVPSEDAEGGTEGSEQGSSTTGGESI